MSNYTKIPERQILHYDNDVTVTLKEWGDDVSVKEMRRAITIGVTNPPMGATKVRLITMHQGSLTTFPWYEISNDKTTEELADRRARVLSMFYQTRKEVI